MSAVESVHPKYALRILQWKKCRDCYEGSDQIKAAGEMYLPRLKGQSTEDYKAYKERALFYSITSKSVSALVGMATAREAKLKYPESLTHYFTDVNAETQFTLFDELYSSLLTEVLLQSRVGAMIDFPVDGGDPYITSYVTEDIINWHVSKNNVLELVVLREHFEDLIDDYNVEIKIRHRELRLVDGMYIQRVHFEDTIQEFIPTIKGQPLDFIPFFVINPFGAGFLDYKPLMLDIASINISHYMTSADLEHGRHFTGLPTPVITGGDTNGDLYIGSTKFIVLPNANSKAIYLEFTGQGLQSLEKAMSEKQGQLASLSARLLDNSSRGSEAADAVKLRYLSETASLTTVVKATNTVLQKIYKTIAAFLNEPEEDVKVMLDTDFMETELSAAEMSSIFDGYFKGAITKETLVYNLRKGQRLDPSRTDDQEIVALGLIEKDKLKQSTPPGGSPQINQMATQT